MWAAARYMLLGGLLCIAASCGNTRYLSKDQALLVKNEVEVKSAPGIKKIRKNIEESLSLSSKLSSLAKQQPNSKTLGLVRFNLFAYNRFYTEKDSGFSHWVMTKVGEPPVILDTTLLPSSALQMKEYMISKGYLFPEVSYHHKVRRNKKAKVSYRVSAGPLYLLDTVFFPIDENELAWIIQGSRNNTLLRRNDAFDADVLGAEQTRLHRDFQNTGYYYFRKEFIYFQADTSIGNHRVNLYVKVERNDTLAEQQKYKIRDIYLFPEFDPRSNPDTVHLDTLQYAGYYFLSNSTYVDPEVLSTSIFLTRDGYYSRKDYTCTLNRISDIGIFKFANVRFRPVPGNLLDAYLYLQPAKKHQVSTEWQVGNVEDNFASGLKVTYSSKNVVKRANHVDLSVSGGIQVPVFNTDSLFYNLTTAINYVMPRFAFPGVRPHISCYNNPQTRLSLKANYFQQVNLYSLANYGISYSMEWKEVDFPLKKFIFPIFAISYVYPTYTAEFKERLDEDPFLAESFSEVFITSFGGAFIFSNQQLNRRSNFTYFRADMETAGNFLQLLNQYVLRPPTDSTGSYDLFGVNYSNYVRYEFDVRQYFQFTQNRTFVLRFAHGMAVPYGNATAIPYIKQFYLGGTSSMRGWRVRSLGPGTYHDTTNSYNSAGDLKLEANAEFRFNIFGKLKGAAFVDAGNIWLLNNDTLKTGGTFHWDTFYEEIAISVGAGFRLDFTYFIMRLDFATPAYDPSRLPGERWVLDDFKLFDNGSFNREIVLQLAVGYPF